VTGGPAVGELILVDEELRIGRAEDGVGALGGDEALADSHALLSCDQTGQWMVRDLGSPDGVYVNGQPLFAIEPVYRGDMLRVGRSRLLVVEGAPRPAGARVSGPPTPPPLPLVEEPLVVEPVVEPVVEVVMDSVFDEPRRDSREVEHELFGTAPELERSLPEPAPEQNSPEPPPFVPGL
jgi:pSer/pThr/pTyr-binding forkhead associated (FHA) protein